MSDRLSAHKRGNETYTSTAVCKMCKSTRERYTHNAMCVVCFDACKMFLSPRYLNRLGEPMSKKRSSSKRKAYNKFITSNGVKYMRLDDTCPSCNNHNYVNVETRQCYNCGTIR